MSAIEPTITVEQYGTNVRVTQDWSSLLDKMARDIADRIDEATLARLGYVKQRTCYDVGRYCFTCSECGHTSSEPHHMFNRNDPNVMPNFCPNCGAKVVDA